MIIYSGCAGMIGSEKGMESFEEARRLAEKYVPRLRYDRAEPFLLEGVGYTVYTADKVRRADAVHGEDHAHRADSVRGADAVHRANAARWAAIQSVSSRLRFILEPGETMIEYAFYYDFDIQHLYDLEHVFIRLAPDGRVSGVLGSFHGKFLNNLLEGETDFEGTHVVLYVQPGKHAFMPAPHYFRLFPDRDQCCREYAGQDGLLIGPMFEGRISTDEAFDRLAERYIRENYAFVPTWEFDREFPRLPGAEERLMPWEELYRQIERRIEEWKLVIATNMQRSLN